MWKVDQGLRFLELSTRAEEDPDAAQRRLDEIVRDAGLQVDPDQQTKTSTVLQHFASTAARGG